MTTWSPLLVPEDKIRIANRLTPGICDIDGLGAPFEWEERGGYGLSGATVVFRGKKLAHFTIAFRLYTAADWADWFAFKPITLRLPIGKNAKGLDINCQLTAMLGIRSIVIEEVKAPKQTGDGEWTVELNVIEFRSPTFTLAAAEGSEATPVDPVQQLIADELAALKAKLGIAAQPNNGNKPPVKPPL